jgi:adenine-specific DNA-methyltransferase
VPTSGWRWPTAERFWELYKAGEIVFGPEQPTTLTFLFEDDSQVMPSVFYSYAQTATQEFEHVCGKKAFDNPKSWRDILRLARYLAPAKRSCVLDYFAGSGTTFHAVATANRLDGAERRCVLVDMGEYFDTVVLKRSKRIMFTPEWKDEKPARRPTKDETTRTPRLVKVLWLESYEDALQNLATDATLAASELKAAAFKDALGEETYRLRYLARLPLEASVSMLQTERLDHPFRYALDVLTDDGAEARVVDLVETFNWLLGLDVRRVRRWEHAKREYRTIEGRDRAARRVLVVWRDTDRLDPKAERAFLEKKVEELTTDAAPFDTMLINGDCAVPGFASLDGMFKQLMEAA